MGGVKSALKKRLQRDPTDAEISAEKQARREQTGPIRSVFSMQVIAGQKSAAGMHYMRAEGPFSEDEMIILHNGAAVVTMLDGLLLRGNDIDSQLQPTRMHPKTLGPCVMALLCPSSQGGAFLISRRVDPHSQPQRARAPQMKNKNNVRRRRDIAV